MDKELLIKLADEANLAGCWDQAEGGLYPKWIESVDLTPYLQKFAALVAEACAEEIEPTDKKSVNWTREQHEAQVCAAAIRAKFPPVEKTVVFDNPSYAQWLRDNGPVEVKP